MSTLLRALVALLLVAGLACATSKPPAQASSTIEVIEEGGADAGAQASALQPVTTEDGFSIALPAPAPEPTRQKATIPAGDVNVAAWSQRDANGVLYSVSIADYPAQLVASARPEAFLAEGRNGVLSQLRNSQLKSEEPVTLQGYPGTSYTVSSDNGEVQARNFLVGNRLYTLLVVYNPAIGAPDAQGFFDSLQLINPPPSLTPGGEADGGTMDGAAAMDGADAGTMGAVDAGTPAPRKRR
jgi:hypothetical protein